MEIGGQLCLLRYLMNLKMSKVLSSGSTIGILGGGQLGQMLSMAAARRVLKHIFLSQAQIHRLQMYHLDLHKQNMMITTN